MVWGLGGKRHQFFRPWEPRKATTVAFAMGSYPRRYCQRWEGGSAPPVRTGRTMVGRGNCRCANVVSGRGHPSSCGCWRTWMLWPLHSADCSSKVESRPPHALQSQSAASEARRHNTQLRGRAGVLSIALCPRQTPINRTRARTPQRWAGAGILISDRLQNATFVY